MRARSLAPAPVLILAGWILATAPGCGGDSKDSGVNPGPDPASEVSTTTSVVTVSSTTLETSQSSVLTLRTKDADGNDLTAGGLTVGFTASGGTSQGMISASTDHGDGTYTASFLALTQGTATTIGATINGSPVTSTLPTIQVTSNPALVDTTGKIPLIDMAGYTYNGFPGLLYPDGNDCPASHVARQPAVDTSQPFVFLSVGFSNAKMEFCDPQMGSIGPQNCADWSFIGKTASFAGKNHNMVMVNGAQGGRVAQDWDSPSDNTYAVVRNTLSQIGYTRQDVQVIWCKMAHKDPLGKLPAPDANAFSLLADIGNVVRSLKTEYPNVRQVYFASRIWSGAGILGSCPATGISVEPFSYEEGFAVKWLIEAQMNQLDGGGVDAIAGDLSLSAAPWLAWGPYLWANGSTPRSDGLIWTRNDLQADCEHPSNLGKDKVSDLLLQFFSTSPLTTPWYLD